MEKKRLQTKGCKWQQGVGKARKPVTPRTCRKKHPTDSLTLAQ